MTLQVIYTFNGLEQQIYDFYEVTLDDISTPEKLVDIAIEPLSEGEKSKVAKLSCCMYLGDISQKEMDDIWAKTPEWYKQCSGKIFLNPAIIYSPS